MPIDIDKIQVTINIALIDYASSSLQELRKTEAAISQAAVGAEREQLVVAARSLRGIALTRLDAVASYLRGEFAVADIASLRKAQSLEAHEPEFVKVRKLATDLTTENNSLKKQLEELQTKINSEAPWACSKCNWRGKTEAALRRHEKRDHPNS